MHIHSHECQPPIRLCFGPSHAPVCGSSDCCVWSACERSTRRRWQGAQRSNKWQNLQCAVFQCVRSGRAGMAPDLPSASFTRAFPSCQFAHDVMCLLSSFACQILAAHVPAPTSVRVLQGAGGMLSGPRWSTTTKSHRRKFLQINNTCPKKSLC